MHVPGYFMEVLLQALLWATVGRRGGAHILQMNEGEILKASVENQQGDKMDTG